MGELLLESCKLDDLPELSGSVARVFGITAEVLDSSSSGYGRRKALWKELGPFILAMRVGGAANLSLDKVRGEVKQTPTLGLADQRLPLYMFKYLSALGTGIEVNKMEQTMVNVQPHKLLLQGYYDSIAGVVVTLARESTTS